MKALKKVRKLIQKNPLDATSRTLSTLVVALESETTFDLGSLYRLPYADFELALELLAEWRLDRYYSSKLQLLDLSLFSGTLSNTSSAKPEIP
jgi:hypothetical protein